MSKKIKIAILDSGVDKTHKRLQKVNFVKELNFTGAGEFRVSDGHGTSICDRIRKTLEKEGALDDCEFYDLQVYTSKNGIVERPIIDALKFCMEEGVDLINLSIGIIADIAPPEELYKCCNEVFNAGILLVSAADNYGNVCYPADFDFVCGVSAGIIENSREFGYDPGTGHFLGKGDMQRLAHLNQKCSFVTGTSYATGHITGMLALHLQENRHKGLSKPDLIDNFKQNSTPGIRIINSESSRKILNSIQVASQSEIMKNLEDCFPADKFSWMKEVAIYPFSNKEFGGLRHFEEQFKYTIGEIFDFPRSLMHQKEVVIKDKTYNLKMAISDIQNEFDTFILGYPEDIASFVNARYYTDILQYIVDKSKNVFCLDPVVYTEIKHLKHSGRAYCPIIKESDSLKYRSLLSLGKVKKPVLAVVGTCSRTGKFSIQLKIRSLLQQEGYATGWLSTEPQGELFGADLSFPYGFSSSVMVSLSDWPAVLAGAIKGIEVRGQYDIILTGHQSGLFLSDSSSLRNTGFMLGVAPDAAVCSISINDSFEYLERMVNIMKYQYEVPILFFILTEIERKWVKDNTGNTLITESYLDKEAWSDHAQSIEKRFNIPVFNAFNNVHDQDMLDEISSFFS